MITNTGFVLSFLTRHLRDFIILMAVEIDILWYTRTLLQLFSI